MLKAVVILALALITASCGSDKPADPGAEVVAKLVEAASEDDASAMWGLLSRSSQRRAGPTEEAFAAGRAKALDRRLAPFGDGYRVIVSERITDQFGVVAIVKGKSAYAVPLRQEGDDWKVELPGPMRIDVLGPRPGSVGPVAQVGVEVHSRGGVGVALLYADGQTLDPKAYSGPKGATILANLDPPLAPGLHNSVAYADLGDNAAAAAWTFTARKS